MIALALLVAALEPQPLAIDAAPPEGLWLHAAADAGVVGGDVALGLEAGIGVESAPFALHLSVPLTLRVVDLAPHVDPGQPAACRVVRCEEWLDAGRASAESVGRAVEEIRVLEPGDVFSLKGGRLFATLGHGALVDEYTNAADWDRRHTGLYAESDLPFGKTGIEALTGDFLAPWELVGTRVAVSPLFVDADQDPDTLARFLGRMRLGFEAALDATAPVSPTDAFGDVVPGAKTRPVGGAGADVTWPLLDDGALQLSPFFGASFTGGFPPGPGAGGIAGLDVDVDAVFVSARAGARVTVDGPGHVTSPFDTLYDVDRKRYALAGGGFSSTGSATLPAPGGVGGGGFLEVLVLRTVRAGARLRLDPVPERNRAEVFGEVDAGSVRVDVRALERAFTDAGSAVSFGDRTFLVADAAWQVWPPFSLFMRWLHGPRFHDAAVRGLHRGDPGADDDVLVGASFDLVFAPAGS